MTISTIYRVFGTLGDKLEFEVMPWKVEKESANTFTIIFDDRIDVTRKRLSKEKVGKINSNTTNDIDGLISYNVYLTDESDIEQYKAEIQARIVNRVRYFKGKLNEKETALKEQGIQV